MPNLNSVVNDGFRIEKPPRNLTRMALYSLRVAIKAYASTYYYLRNKLHYFDIKPGETEENFISAYNNNYYMNCAETIIHFQHFFELVIKDLLRKIHVLLANDASNYPIVLKRLLKNESIDDLNFEQIKSVEFKEALERLIKLIKEENYGKGKYNFIVKNKEILEKLNGLRNRIWHRGTFLLHYPSLDLFVGKYILPLAMEFASLYPYNKVKSVWKFKALNCNIDPLKMLINSFKKNQFNIKKIAILKELIRASFENPIHRIKRIKSKSIGSGFIIGKELQSRPEFLAKSLDKLENNIDKLGKCPVCGALSLVSFFEMDGEFDGDGNILHQWHYVYNIKCFCCSFELFREVGNPRKYKINLDNYFTTFVYG